MNIRKRNGSEVKFNRNNIIEAISRANEKVRLEEKLTIQEIKDIAKDIEDNCKNSPVAIGYKDIQRLVEKAIMKAGKYEVATEYITFRYQKALDERKNTIDDRVLSLLNGENEDIQQENANKNPNIVSTMRDYMAGEVSKDISQRYLIPSDIYDAHKEGIIHFHDMDYFAMPIHNCCLINLDDMLQNGTIISGTQIDKPHTFRNACNIASQIVAQVASSQYGGQTITASHLSKFINVSREYFKKEFPTLSAEQIEDLVKKDIRDGVQTLQYQILTLQTTNGQTPFVSVCLYLNEAENEEEKENLALVIEEILKQRIKGVKNENGQYYANPFPKLLYVLEEDNIHEGDKYYYLTQLAAECTTKRMVPDYISEKIMKKLKISKKGEEGDCYPCMGCRSFLTPYRDPATKKPKYYGRFNQGVVTINLPDVALSAKGDIDKFWYILEQRLELCHRALRLRHEHLRGVKSDVAPILWQNGAFARLKKGETIDKLLYNGYSTISLGYAGLYETVKVLCGKSLTDEEGMNLGKKIMKTLNDKCNAWKQVEKIDYSVYGTPIENTTEKFAKCLQRRFGTNEGITDRNYVTNSYHVPVFEQIDAFKKIDIEAELQKLSPGGAISYIETPNMENNVEAVLTVIKYIYDNILYCEINRTT
ncbi:MAG: anaerobic ribonucleoside-triphosphate reductase [Methanobrevibacter sp.]|nr:anaerobic ribonucleoside-triphosphate reductase [Methanobrevibacter sp.]